MAHSRKADSASAAASPISNIWSSLMGRSKWQLAPPFPSCVGKVSQLRPAASFATSTQASPLQLSANTAKCVADAPALIQYFFPCKCQPDSVCDKVDEGESRLSAVGSSMAAMAIRSPVMTSGTSAAACSLRIKTELATVSVSIKGSVTRY